MATLVLTDAKIYLAQYDISGFSNRVGLMHESDAVPDTRFGATARQVTPGLKVSEITADGLQDFADNAVDEALFGQIGVIDKPLTIAAEGGDDGELAYLLQAIAGRYKPLSAQVGETSPFQLEARNQGGRGIVRGTILHNNTAETATGQGTARQVGAVTAAQRVYAALHVFTVSGSTPTFDLDIESDNAEGMSSPTVRLTFTQATAAFAEWKSVAGAITDDWWRASWTIAGGSPSFAFAVAIGIL